MKYKIIDIEKTNTHLIVRLEREDKQNFRTITMDISEYNNNTYMDRVREIIKNNPEHIDNDNIGKEFEV